MNTHNIYNFIKEKLLRNDSTTIVSGEIHKELNLTNRHPMVCSAMRNLTKAFKHEYLDDHTPSGQTSTLAIRYYR